MAEISQTVNIEMLEKLPDGTYKRKYPKTRADDGTTFDEHLAESTQQAHLAKNIGLEDVAGNFVATEVEGAMNELFTNVSDGKDLVGGAITDVDDSVVLPTEPSFQDLATGIGQISTGKKWASGTISKTDSGLGSLTVRNLDFKPTIIITKGISTSSEIHYTAVYVDSLNLGSNSDVNLYFLGSATTASAGDVTLFEDGFTIRSGTPSASGIGVGWIAFE